MHNINLNLIKNKPKPEETVLINKRICDFNSYSELSHLYPTKEVYVRFADKQEYLINKSNLDYYRNHFAKQEYKIIFKKPPRREFNPSGGGWDSVMRW